MFYVHAKLQRILKGQLLFFDGSIVYTCCSLEWGLEEFIKVVRGYSMPKSLNEFSTDKRE
jgi:hypothetical protein